MSYSIIAFFFKCSGEISSSAGVPQFTQVVLHLEVISSSSSLALTLIGNAKRLMTVLLCAAKRTREFDFQPFIK